MKIFISPHNDDAVLFGSFSILKHGSMKVLTVYDSYVQVKRGNPECDWITRRAEDHAALRRIYRKTIDWLGVPDNEDTDIDQLIAVLKDSLINATEVWFPAHEEGGHQQHNYVAAAARYALRSRPSVKTHSYLTYTRDHGKSRWGTEVQPADPYHVILKHRALACYESQIMNPVGCLPWFMQDLTEYETT